MLDILVVQPDSGTKNKQRRPKKETYDGESPAGLS